MFRSSATKQIANARVQHKQEVRPDKLIPSVYRLDSIILSQGEHEIVYRVTNVVGDTVYVDIKTRVAPSIHNEGIVQPRESEIEHIVSMAFTEFFPVEGSGPKILPLTERSHHHHRQLTYC